MFPSKCSITRHHDWRELDVQSDGDTFVIEAYCQSCPAKANEQGLWQGADQKCLHQNIETMDTHQDNLEVTTMELKCVECGAESLITLRWNQ